MDMNIFPKNMPVWHKRIIGAAVVIAAVAILAWLWTALSDANYLRTTASLGQTNSLDETLTSNTWHTYQDASIPLSFEVPVEWKTAVDKTGSGKYIGLKNIKVWYYESTDQDTNTIITQILGTSVRNMVSYPAKVGTTSGTMWAKASVVDETKAPIGPRVYIPAINRGLAIVLLPTPPYTDIQLRIINSLAAR